MDDVALLAFGDRFLGISYSEQMLRRAALALSAVMLGGCLTAAAGSSLRGCSSSSGRPELSVTWLGPKARGRGPSKCRIRWIDAARQSQETGFVKYGRISLLSSTFDATEERAVLGWACQLGGTHILRLASPNRRVQNFVVLKLDTGSLPE